MTTDSQLSMIPQDGSFQDMNPLSKLGNFGSIFVIYSSDKNSNLWLIDSKATDYTIYDQRDFTHRSLPRCTNVVNANRPFFPITRAGSVALSPSLHLSHTLHVPSISHKLLSVGQVFVDLNCVVLIYLNFSPL